MQRTCGAFAWLMYCAVSALSVASVTDFQHTNCKPNFCPRSIALPCNAANNCGPQSGAQPSPSLSHDATLQALTISNGVLKPPFSSRITTFSVSLAHSIAHVNIVATTCTNATLKMNGVSTASGAPFNRVLAAGVTNRVVMTVTAQDGQTIRVYTMHLFRYAPAEANGLAAAAMPPPNTGVGHYAMDIGGIGTDVGADGQFGSTSPQTYHTDYDTPRSPHNSNGLCGTRHCNGVGAARYGVPEGKFNQHDWRREHSCYTDQDCQFYEYDSNGVQSGAIVGKCVRRSDTLSMCECLAPYFGNNCEFKFCPKATAGHVGLRDALPGEATSPGAFNMASAGDSGGGSSEQQISAPFVGGVLGVGRRWPAAGHTTLDTNRGGNPEEGFECGGKRGDCQYSTGKCVCKEGFHGKACEYRTAANGCSTTGASTHNCVSTSSLRHHSGSNTLTSVIQDSRVYKTEHVPRKIRQQVNTRFNRAGHAGHNQQHSAFNAGNLDNPYKLGVERDASVPHAGFVGTPHAHTDAIPSGYT